MTIGEFVSILDYKFIITLCPMDDMAKQKMRTFMTEHKEEYGLESSEDFIHSHNEISLTFSVGEFDGDIKDTFNNYHVLKTVNDLYDRNTLLLYYK